MTDTKHDRRVLTAQLSSPLRSFLATESGSAGLLAAATILALLWANSPWSATYESFFSTNIGFRVGAAEFGLELRNWIDEGLMAIFFFVVGMEVRRELSMGELTDRRTAIVPLLGAVGGMVVPVIIFLLLAPENTGHGWAIVIGTDTAFVLGALALVGPSVSTQLRIFLLTTAIVDDIVAISVIGLFYSADVDLRMLTIAGVFLGLILLLGVFDVRRISPYLILGSVVWFAAVNAGVHATIAGMAVGLLVIAYPPRRHDVLLATRLARAFRQSPFPSSARQAKASLQRAISPNERLQAALHSWASYVIVPVFALAFAGIDLRGGMLQNALSAPLTWAVVAGLVIGKFIGIPLASVGAAKLDWGDLPSGVSPRQILGGGALSGIGFTVSLLIATLAFGDGELREQAVVGILLAAILSTLLGSIVFRAAAKRGDTRAALPTKLAVPFDPERDRYRGRIDAPYVLVEYADFECPFCSLARNSIQELHDRLGDDLLYVFRHLPMEDVHPNAVLAAQIAEAAADQGRFWETHDRFFAYQSELDADSLVVHAVELGLDIDELLDDLDKGVVARQVREDVAGAEASGARSTPTFFTNGERVTGAYDAATLERLLKATAKKNRDEVKISTSGE